MNGLSAIEAIRFFGSVASTNGISEKAKEQANKYIERLMISLAPEVDATIAEMSGIIT